MFEPLELQEPQPPESDDDDDDVVIVDDGLNWADAEVPVASGDRHRRSQVLAHVTVHEHRHEIHDPSVSQEVLADAGELAVHRCRVELTELTRDLGLGLPHPLLEVLVAVSHRDADLDAENGAASSRATCCGMRRVGELAKLGGQEIRDLLADVDGMVADPLERA
jgi:hypothetical protein